MVRNAVSKALRGGARMTGPRASGAYLARPRCRRPTPGGARSGRRRGRRLHPPRGQGAHHRASTPRCARSGCIRSRTRRYRTRPRSSRASRRAASSTSTSSRCACPASSCSSTPCGCGSTSTTTRASATCCRCSAPSGIGSLHLHAAPTVEGVAALPRAARLSVAAIRPATRFDAADGASSSSRGSTSFELGEPMAQARRRADREKSKEVAKRTYAQSVAVTQDLMTSVRMGGRPNIKKIKRVVQGIVDQILNEETSLIGLTTIRDYDEYTFTHSVNVCIFSVALGKRLGLGKVQLYDLGMAALFHDIGKSRVPAEILNKSGGLTDDEWRLIAAHPWLGALALFQTARAAGTAVPRDDRGARASHEARPHRLPATDPAERRSACSARSSRWRTASMPPPRGGRTRPMPLYARAGDAGDARQPAPRHGSGGGEGVHQPHRHLPGGHARRARYLRARDRARREPDPRDAVAADRARHQ